MYSANDIVYSVHEWDGNKVFHDIVCVYWRVTGVLDASKIHDALWKLLQIGDWRKIGGRLRYNNGKLENHVPRQFTAERPAFNFFHESFDHPIACHPLAGAFPHASAGVSVKKPPADPKTLAYGPGFPRTVEDIFDRDMPHLSLKIMTFTDASLMISSFSHIIWDALGFVAMMKMVQLILDGQEDQITPILGTQSDVLADIASQYKDDEELETTFSKPSDPKVTQQAPLPQVDSLEERIVCLPRKVLHQIRDRELPHENNGRDVEDYQYFRDDELCIAWVSQQMARSAPTPRPVALVNLLNVRFLVPSICKAKGIYVQNMLLLAPNIIPFDIAIGPTAPILNSQRDCLLGHAGPQQVGKFLKSFRESIEENTVAMLLGDGHTSMPVLVNNLAKVTENLDVNLSSAIVHRGKETTRTSAVGRVNFIHVTNLTRSFIKPASLLLLGFAHDTFWLSGNLPARTWELIQEDLEDL